MADWNTQSHQTRPALSDMHLLPLFKKKKKKENRPSLGCFHGWIESFHCHLWAEFGFPWELEHQSLRQKKKKPPILVKGGKKKSIIPEKSGLFLEMLWFSFYKPVNIYYQRRPGKKKEWKLNLFIMTSKILRMAAVCGSVQNGRLSVDGSFSFVLKKNFKHVWLSIFGQAIIWSPFKLNWCVCQETVCTHSQRGDQLIQEVGL